MRLSAQHLTSTIRFTAADAFRLPPVAVALPVLSRPIDGDVLLMLTLAGLLHTRHLYSSTIVVHFSRRPAYLGSF